MAHDEVPAGGKSGELNGEDWKKIGIGFLVAAVGAALTYGVDTLLPELQAKELIDAGMFVFFTTLTNAARRWLSDYSTPGS